MALESLDPGAQLLAQTSPLVDLQNSANTSPSSSIDGVIANLRQSAGPVDPMSSFLLQRTTSAMAQPDLSGQANTLHTAMQAQRDKYLANLDDGYSAKTANNLDWQAIARMGTAMMQPATNGGNAFANGAQAFQNARDDNQLKLDQAQKDALTAHVGASKEDYNDVLAQQAVQKAEKDASLKELIEYHKEVNKNKASSFKTFQDRMGNEFGVDGVDASPHLIKAGLGLTNEDKTSLANYGAWLRTQTTDPATFNRMYVAEQQRLIDSNTRSPLENVAQPQTTATPTYEGTTLPDAELDKIKKAANNGNVDAKSVLESYSNSPQSVPVDGKVGIWDKGMLYNPPVDHGVMLPRDEENLKDKNKNLQALELENLKTLSTNFSQGQTMLESMRAARSLDADTGTFAPVKQVLGNVLSGVGIDGTLSDEAVKLRGMDTITNQAVQVLQNAAKGPQTEGDAQRFKDSLVKATNRKEANDLIIKYQEAQLWKQQQALDFRTRYNQINPTPDGATEKFSEWNMKTPAIQNIKGHIVSVADYVNDYVDHNPKVVASHGTDYVKAQAIKAWQTKAR